jgi:outer membrane lipoprotein carrier protein
VSEFARPVLSRLTMALACRVCRFLLPVLVCLPFAPSAIAQATGVAAVARAVDEHYNHLKSFRSAFTETYVGPGISRSESGTVWLKKPGRMRWEYHQPKEKLFLTDSQNAYFYVPGELQARRTPLSKIDDIRSPLRYLLGKTKLEKELDGLSLAPDVAPLQLGNTVLRGAPKGMKDRVSDVWLEITPARQIVRIVVHGVDGTTTDFRFTQLEEDIPVQDSFFRLQLPPGVTVIDENQIIE